MPDSFTYEKNRTAIAGLLPGFVRLNSGLEDVDGVPVPAVNNRQYTSEQRIAHGFALRMLKSDGYCMVGIFRPKYRINDNDYRLDRFGDSDIAQEYVTPSNFQDAIAIPVYRNRRIKDLLLAGILSGGNRLNVYGFINRGTDINTKRRAYWDTSTSSGWNAPSGATYDKFLGYSMNQLTGDGDVAEITFAASRGGYTDRFYVFSARYDGTARNGIVVSVPGSAKILKVFTAAKPEAQDYCGIVLYQTSADKGSIGYFKGNSTTVIISNLSLSVFDRISFSAANLGYGVMFVGYVVNNTRIVVTFTSGANPTVSQQSAARNLSIFPLRGFEFPAYPTGQKAYMLGFDTNNETSIRTVSVDYASGAITERASVSFSTDIYKPVQIVRDKFVAADSTLFWQGEAIWCAQYLAKEDGTNDYYVRSFFVRVNDSEPKSITANIAKLLPIYTNCIPIGMHTFSDLLARS
jgi:hypothetical protein